MKIFAGAATIVGLFFIVLFCVNSSVSNTSTVSPSTTSVVPDPPRNIMYKAPHKKPVTHISAENNNTLFLFGEVAEENSEAVSQGILALSESGSADPILLVIDSPGGAVFAGSKIISAIEASKRPVYTICYGLCASMAAIIHQYGTKRLMTNRSILMFHNASGGAQGEVNQMLSQLNFVDRFCLKMDIYISNRAGMSYPQFAHYLDSQLWIDSEDSLSLGFNDGIVSLNLTNVKKTSLLPFMNRAKHTAERIEIK